MKTYVATVSAVRITYIKVLSAYKNNDFSDLPSCLEAKVIHWSGDVGNSEILSCEMFVRSANGKSIPLYLGNWVVVDHVGEIHVMTNEQFKSMFTEA